jgi:hypothetical protein
MTIPRSSWALVLPLCAAPLLHEAPSRTWTAVGMVVGAVALVGLRGDQAPRAGRALAMAAAGFLVIALALSQGGIDIVLSRWFGPVDGLIYWNPALWLAVCGLAFALSDPRVGLGLLAAVAFVMLRTGSVSSSVVAGAVPVLLVPAVLASADRLRGSASARPMAWLSLGAAALMLWNALFMEQYRRNLIPRDDTVSFAEVAGNNAALLVQVAGSPLTWPASWLFAVRHRVPVDRYEALVSSPPFSLAWLEGWSAPARCPAGECRELQGNGRFVTMLPAPADIDLTLWTAGAGTLALRVNDAAVADLPLATEGAEARLRIASDYWRAGFNDLRLVASGSAPVVSSRILLRRVGGGT